MALSWKEYSMFDLNLCYCNYNKGRSYKSLRLSMSYLSYPHPHYKKSQLYLNNTLIHHKLQLFNHWIFSTRQKSISLWRPLKSLGCCQEQTSLHSMYSIITDTNLSESLSFLSKFRVRSSAYRLTAALSLADLPLGFSSTSSLLGSTTFLCSLTQWTLSLPPSSSSASSSSSSSSFLCRWARALWRMLWRGGALRSSPLRKRLAMRSSSEWNVRTQRRPPGRRRSWAAWSPATSSFSSSFTKIRSAWKVLVATCEGLCRRSRRAYRALAGNAPAEKEGKNVRINLCWMKIYYLIMIIKNLFSNYIQELVPEVRHFMYITGFFSVSTPISCSDQCRKVEDNF